MVLAGATIGRPREQRIDEAVRAAVLALLAEHGYAGTTIARIAARAGVGPAALYRRWSSKPELVFAATVHDLELPEPADTGSLEGDLCALAKRIQELLTSEGAVAAISGLAAEVYSDTALAGALEERLFASERAHLETILLRARRRRQLRDDASAELLRLLLVGPLVHAALFSPRRPADPAAVASVISRGLAA